MYLGACSEFSDEAWWEHDLAVKSSSPIRRFIKPQRLIEIEGQLPFNPVARDCLLPTIEWGMNWAVAAFSHQFLMIHAAVAVKGDKAIVFPAESGSGKSTLSTYLGAHGWALYSDEIALIDLEHRRVHPSYRPTSLKNQSIEIIRQTCPNVWLSKTTYGTHKGDIAHARLYTPEQAKQFQPAVISSIVLPQYQPNVGASLKPIPQVDGFAATLRQAFNYNVLGKPAFAELTGIVSHARCYRAVYSKLDEMAKLLDEVVCD